MVQSRPAVKLIKKTFVAGTRTFYCLFKMLDDLLKNTFGRKRSNDRGSEDLSPALNKMS